VINCWFHPLKLKHVCVAHRVSHCVGLVTSRKLKRIGSAFANQPRYVPGAGKLRRAHVNLCIQQQLKKRSWVRLPLSTRGAQLLLRRVRPWVEAAQSFEKNQLGLSEMFFNSLRLTWCMALLADSVCLLRAQALLKSYGSTKALLSKLAPRQMTLDLL
jgi:hypothetical protein